MRLLKNLAGRLTNARIKKTRAALSKIIRDIQQARNISEIRNIKKHKGFKNFYRIRIGDYRIGVAFKDGKIILAAFDHRSDIYTYFP